MSFDVEGSVLKISRASKENAHRVILAGNSPVVFENMISEWPAKHWSVGWLCSRFPNMMTKFRVCSIRPTLEKDGPVMETDCKYVDATLNDFLLWLEGNEYPKSPFNDYPRSEYSVYADYKYMHTFFQNEPEMLQAVDWGAFGFNGRGGNESTIWIGSNGASTPCHQDCYGFNLVGQLAGRKRWTLFSPEDSSKLYPTRIPYEESSIFSSVNLKNPNMVKHPKFKDAKIFEVTLKAGDVLYVPKHWWHYVENLESSVSVNTWIEKESDSEDRVKEAITRTLICCLKESENSSCCSWLNPNEELYTHETNLNYLRLAMSNLVKNNPQKCENTFNTDDLIDCLVSRNVMNALITEIRTKFVSKQ